MPAGTDPGDRGAVHPREAQLIAQAPAPDAIQSPAGRGKLRTYLGIAPGVGKTYAMMRDARTRRRSS